MCITGLSEESCFKKCIWEAFYLDQKKKLRLSSSQMADNLNYLMARIAFWREKKSYIYGVPACNVLDTLFIIQEVAAYIGLTLCQVF